MRRKHTIWLLSSLAIILLLLAGLETYHLYSGLRHLNLPTQQTRQPLGRNAHGWMNVDQLAHLYQVPVPTVFSALNIQPAPGDDKLTLQELAQKYNKTPAEIDQALLALKNQSPRRRNSRG